MEKKNILLAVVLAVCFLSFTGLVYSQGLDTTIKYLKQERDKASVQQCMANLRQINPAKHIWALDKKEPNGSTPTWNDLTPEYIPKQLTCPLGGIYTIGRVSEPPTCSIKEHNPDPSVFK